MKHLIKLNHILLIDMDSIIISFLLETHMHENYVYGTQANDNLEEILPALR